MVFLKETITAIMILYKNTKVMVRSFDIDTDFFDRVTGVLQGDTSVPYLFILCQNYELWISTDLIKEIWFHSEKSKKQMISSKNYERRRLRRWPWSSCMYTSLSRISAAQHRASSGSHRLLRDCTPLKRSTCVLNKK